MFCCLIQFLKNGFFPINEKNNNNNTLTFIVIITIFSQILLVSEQRNAVQSKYSPKYLSGGDLVDHIVQINKLSLQKFNFQSQ